jgi:ABC-type polysaccharide/polyol phosphate export permease
MYLTPIIYPITLVQTQSDKTGPLFGTSFTLVNIYQLNPMESFVTVFRELLYDNRFPSVEPVLECVCWTLVSLALGVWVFRRSERGLAEAL